VPIEIKGIERLNAKLQALAAKFGGGKPVVAVGYSANYALYVHENMEIWPPGMRLKGLPRGQGFRRKDGVVYVPKRVLTSGKVGGKNRGFYWDPQGKAGPKFLEGPARELHAEIGRIVAEALLTGATMATALLRAGLRLQRESQQRVPVDTGNLKASAFTRLEFEEFDVVAAQREVGVGEQIGVPTI
jgi:hypothetical protein